MSAILATFPDENTCEKSHEERVGLSLIEHLAVLGEKSCKNPKAPILFGSDNKEKKSLVIKAACKSWNCEPCGARKTRYWIARALDGTRLLGGQWYFMTITPHPDWKEKGASLQNIRKNWGKLRKRIKRKSKTFDYLKVFEHFEDGEYHLHLITNAVLPYTITGQDEDGNDTFYCKWLKDTAHKSGMGYIADYQPIRSPAGTAYYVAKYVSKSIGDGGKVWEKGLRRIEASHNFPKLPELHEASELEWSYVKSEKHMVELAFESLERGNSLYGQNSMKTSVNGLLKMYRKVRDGDNSNDKRRNESAVNRDADTANQRESRTSELSSRGTALIISKSSCGRNMGAQAGNKTNGARSAITPKKDGGILNNGKDRTRASI